MNYILNPFLIIDFYNENWLLIKNIRKWTTIRYKWDTDFLFNFITKTYWKAILLSEIESIFKNESVSFNTINYLIDKEFLIKEELYKEIKQELDIWLKHNWVNSLIYHFASNNPNYIEPYSENWLDSRITQHEKYLKSEWIPEIYKSHKYIKIYKWNLLPINSINIDTLIYSRKTVRNFNWNSIDFDVLYSIFYYSMNKVKKVRVLIENYENNICLLKNSEYTSLEFYIVVFDIVWLESWIYHFNLKDESFWLVTKWNFRNEIKNIQMWQHVLDNAKYAIYVSCDYSKHMWRYRYAHKMRALLIQVWKIAQDIITLSLSYNIWSFMSPAIKDTPVWNLLWLDNEKELCLYFMCFWMYNSDKTESYFFDNIQWALKK